MGLTARGPLAILRHHGDRCHALCGTVKVPSPPNSAQVSCLMSWEIYIQSVALCVCVFVLGDFGYVAKYSRLLTGTQASGRIFLLAA